MYQKIIHSGRHLSRWIPDQAVRVDEPSGHGVVFVYRKEGRVVAVGYRGNAAKPSFHYHYKDMEAVDLAVCNFFESIASRKQHVAKWRAESYAPHSFKVGDVVTNSWGYDQTNVDWYRVVRASDHYVWLQPIGAHVTETGFMSGDSKPYVDTQDANPERWGYRDTGDPVEKHRAAGSHVSFRFGCGSKWEGETKYASWYA